MGKALSEAVQECLETELGWEINLRAEVAGDVISYVATIVCPEGNRVSKTVPSTRLLGEALLALQDELLPPDDGE